jgi:hypothetical protein
MTITAITRAAANGRNRPRAISSPHDLADAAGDRMEAARSHAEGLHEFPRAADSPATEPTEQLLSAVPEQEEPDHYVQKEESDIHETSSRRLRKVSGRPRTAGGTT